MFCRRPSRSFARVAVLAAAVASTSAACGGDDSGAVANPQEVLASGGSVAQVLIGDQTYDFVVDCYDAGAGSVVVVGAGHDSADHDDGSEPRETRILVQAFLRDSYVGLTVEPGADGAEEEVYEASLHGALDLMLDGDIIEADDISFVRDLDLELGSGTPAGNGALRVVCGTYEAGSPTSEGA